MGRLGSSWSPRERRRLARDAGGILLVCLLMLLGWPFAYGVGVFGWDSHAYWMALRHTEMYGLAPLMVDAYLYSPAFAQVLQPLTTLPWPVFAALWAVGLGVALAWLLAPLRWWAVPLWLVGVPEIVAGNVFILLALVAVFGMRWPGVWAFALLTKVSVGLGPVWFALRREWRGLGVSLGVTLVVVALSVAYDPRVWVEWVTFLAGAAVESTAAAQEVAMPPILYRLPFALAAVAYGALTNRKWLLPVAMVLASPVVWLGALTILAAIPRLHVASRGEREAARARRESAPSSATPEPVALTTGG
ncbi:MAG TPA: glycosyltransferase family 87 protein [Pedococcus sp.]